MDNNPYAQPLRAAHVALEVALEAGDDAALEAGLEVALMGIGIEMATAAERAAFNEALDRFLSWEGM